MLQPVLGDFSDRFRRFVFPKIIAALLRLQFCTYGFIYPLLYYFAKERMMDADMAKRQAVSMSFYTLGTAFGSYAGGILIDAFGVEKMLFTALLSALAGTVIINMTVGKTDNIN